jgi:hypothetical protein
MRAASAAQSLFKDPFPFELSHDAQINKFLGL